MKTLILSCNTGEGHNSSAKALKKAMDSQGIECEVQDTLALISTDVSKNVSDVYVYSTKSSLFEKAYRIGETVSSWENSVKSPVYMANKLYAKKLYDKPTEGGYDVVICVHLFPAEALTALRRKARLDIPSVFVMTDYTCIPFLPETELDRYVIAHEDLVEEFVEKGIPREKIVPLGIPVDEERYGTRLDRNAARALVCDEFAWEPSSEESRWFLIMGGSMGFGNMGGLISTLLQRIQPDDRVICICGRNEVQKTSLLEEFGYDGRFLATGFTDRVPELMDASDVLFSKPGGITGTEAVLKNIPLVHTSPIPGLETYNARFFHYHNMSYSTSDPLMQAEVALRLCNDASWRERMVQAQKRNSNSRCCRDITELVLTLTRK